MAPCTCFTSGLFTGTARISFWPVSYTHLPQTHKFVKFDVRRFAVFCDLRSQKTPVSYTHLDLLQVLLPSMHLQIRDLHFLPQGMHCRAELRSCFFFSLIFPPYIFSDRLYLLNFCGVKRTFLFVTYISTNASASRSVVLVIL